MKSETDSLRPTGGPPMNSEKPGVDGVLSITGPYGKSVLRLELCGESSYAHMTLKVGQRHYTIDIRPMSGPDTVAQMEEIRKLEVQVQEDDLAVARALKAAASLPSKIFSVPTR